MSSKQLYKYSSFKKNGGKGTGSKLDRNVIEELKNHVSGELTIQGGDMSTTHNMEKEPSRKDSLPRIKSSYKSEKDIQKGLKHSILYMKPGTKMDFYLENMFSKKHIDTIIKKEDTVNRKKATYLTNPSRTSKSRNHKSSKNLLSSKNKMKRTTGNTFKKKFSSRQLYLQTKNQKPLRLGDMEYSRALPNYRQMEAVFEKNKDHFKVQNKVEEINYK